jgi:alkylation response protein AidB-like acyl-CoA dehydrogenase
VLDMTRSDEFIALESAVRAVAADRITVGAAHPDRSATVPPAALLALDRMGLLAPRAIDDGGEGIPDHLGWTAIAEELAKGDAGTALDVIMGAYAAIIVSRCGDEQQRRDLGSSGTDAGPRRGTVLYYEGYGRSPLELESTATAVDGGWALFGRKSVVVRADSSDYGVTIARAGSDLLAVRLSAANLGSLPRTRDGSISKKLGVRAASTSVVELTDLTGGELLSARDSIVLHQCVAGMRLAVASILIGTGAAAVTYAAEYASNREAFGRTIADFQGVAFPLADADTAVEAARLSIRDLAADIDGIHDAERLADRTARAVAGAVHAGTLATATAVNTLGGHGYLTDHPVERWYRDAAVLATIDFDPLLTDWSPSR